MRGNLRRGTSACVAVVGSANLDTVVEARRAPEAGETVHGERLTEAAGGKGLNQAIAAAARARAALVGVVGTDEAGETLTAALRDGGVNTAWVTRSVKPTSRAIITVSGDGENRIVVLPGANDDLARAGVTRALEEIAPALVLCPMETSPDSVRAAALWARERGAQFVLNPSPVRDLPEGLLGCVSLVIVNLGEAEALSADLGLEIRAAGDGEHVAGLLATALSTRVPAAVVTAGSDGAYFACAGESARHADASPVAIVDSTGAGDAFAGTLASCLVEGLDLGQAVRAASAAAARIITLHRAERASALVPECLVDDSLDGTLRVTGEPGDR